MNTTLKSLADWLEANKGGDIRIRKEEQEDLDEVRLSLAGYELSGDRSDAIDDYTRGSALMLQGQGTVITAGEEAPLPSDTFEIPLAGLTEVHSAAGAVTLRTERAVYRLEAAE